VPSKPEGWLPGNPVTAEMESGDRCQRKKGKSLGLQHKRAKGLGKEVWVLQQRRKKKNPSGLEKNGDGSSFRKERTGWKKRETTTIGGGYTEATARFDTSPQKKENRKKRRRRKRIARLFLKNMVHTAAKEKGLAWCSQWGIWRGRKRTPDRHLDFHAGIKKRRFSVT